VIHAEAFGARQLEPVREFPDELAIRLGDHACNAEERGVERSLLELGVGAGLVYGVSEVGGGGLEVVIVDVGRTADGLAKGGITSSHLATRALEVKRAMVLGQVALGVPVWHLGDEARFRGLAFIVFPGNVSALETFAQVVLGLRRNGL
jgi:hypothetical protein